MSIKYDKERLFSNFTRSVWGISTSIFSVRGQEDITEELHR